MKNIAIGKGISTVLNPAGSKNIGRGVLATIQNQEKVTKPFGETLAASLQKVNNLQLEADRAVEDLVAGKTKSIHEAMIALNKADITFRLTMQIRNKIVESYKEIVRMPV